MSLGPGDVVAGKYRIERKLGEGGMGAVYAARHLELGGRVAVKVMLESGDSTDGSARFNREAKAASRLRGEHIVRTLDAGKVAGGSPFIVLEYVDGVDLERMIVERAPMPTAEAVELLVQACEGVAEAHALRMVHRDLKPRNMLVATRPDGSALLKILDFGVVKMHAGDVEDTVTKSSVTLTQADALIGSAHYMAPEQIQMSSKVDARADVWSLGVCLYRMLSGERPFEGATLAQVFNAILGRPPKPIDELRPDVPISVARAVERALEKNLQRRFQSVAELAGALDPRAFDRIDAILRGGKPAARTSDPGFLPHRADASTRHASETRIEGRKRLEGVPTVADDPRDVTESAVTAPLRIAPAPPAPLSVAATPNVVTAIAPPPPPLELAPKRALRAATVGVAGAVLLVVGVVFVTVARSSPEREAAPSAPSAPSSASPPASSSAPIAIEPSPSVTPVRPPAPSAAPVKSAPGVRPIVGRPKPTASSPAAAKSDASSPYDRF